ncbi:MAG TPA: RHS repeat-associated core domain-containing protein [Azospirillaceae bacterium]|nr:RHS repeat-associated core domain-containing protein [Azospirillaceae bacterium]
MGGTNYDLVHAGTTNAERTKLGPTWFHHTALGLASTTTNGVDTGFIREPAGTLNSMTTGGKSYYYLTDATGNVLGLVDDAGKRTHTYAYSPTGLPRGTTTEAAPQPFRYTGAYLDPTSLYKMGARYYDPQHGRFTQPDPSGQETNAYLYAGGDPINNSDPSGLGFLDSVSNLFDDTNDIWGAVTGCIAGIEAAATTNIIATATIMAGPWGTAAAVAGSCAVGGVLGYNNVDLISYG